MSERYFPRCEPAGDKAVQVIAAGPDEQINSIRQMYIAAMNSARQRLWIASPYFVPDNSMLDALYLARARDVDVRLLCLMRPDHYVSFYAGRYYWDDLLAAGMKIYQYCRGMMHCKTLIVDGRWSMVGSANLDNRSLRLNFEAGCIFHDEAIARSLERAFERDLADSIQLTPEAFAKRSLISRVVENICRLLSPIL
jgi:cardiolipin synthase